MADGLMAALQSKLVTYENAGMDDHARRVKARIAELEKAAKAPAAPAAAVPKAEPVKKAAAPKKAAKKAKK